MMVVALNPFRLMFVIPVILLPVFKRLFNSSKTVNTRIEIRARVTLSALAARPDNIQQVSTIRDAFDHVVGKRCPHYSSSFQAGPYYRVVSY